jgi:hypothetical protein
MLRSQQQLYQHSVLVGQQPAAQQPAMVLAQQSARKKGKKSSESSLSNEKTKSSLSDKRGSIVKSIDKLASSIASDEASSAASASSASMMPMFMMLQMQQQQQQQQMQLQQLIAARGGDSDKGGQSADKRADRSNFGIVEPNVSCAGKYTQWASEIVVHPATISNPNPMSGGTARVFGLFQRSSASKTLLQIAICGNLHDGSYIFFLPIWKYCSCHFSFLYFHSINVIIGGSLHYRLQRKNQKLLDNRCRISLLLSMSFQLLLDFSVLNSIIMDDLLLYEEE